MINKSMWFNLRKRNTDYTQEDVAEMLNVARNTIACWESGIRSIPIKAQILYLSFRNNEEDKFIIQYLEHTKDENFFKGE